MSFALTVVVLGHAFFTTVSNAVPIAPNVVRIRNITQPLHQLTLEYSSISIISNINEPLTVGQLTTTPEPDARRADYTYIPNIGAYKVHTRAANWQTAKLICEDEGSHLAIINSDTESRELKRLFLASRPCQIGSFHSHYAIIGFRERLPHGNGYVTVFDEPLEDTGFYTWAATEPNNLNGQEHCGSMDDSGFLNDVNCKNKYSFICEIIDHIATNQV